MTDFETKLSIPEPGDLVTISHVWWKQWENIINADPSIPLQLNTEYKLAWTNLSKKDLSYGPFLVIKSKTDISYVRRLGRVVNVEFLFLVGEQTSHLFVEVRDNFSLNEVLNQMFEAAKYWRKITKSG